MELTAHDPLALTVVSAIQSGDVERLQQLLSANGSLANAAVVDNGGTRRTLLHIAADWPGHFPNGAATVTALLGAGADPNPVVTIPGRTDTETPLHWAASSNDVAVLEALLDGGADIEAPGAVFTGGTAMSDAVVFAQWDAARLLLARGAATTLWQSAALGLMDRLRTACEGEPQPSRRNVTNALWHACRGGQREAAAYLLERGADVNWIGHDRKTSLQVAEESGVPELVAWLRAQGAR